MAEMPPHLPINTCLFSPFQTSHTSTHSLLHNAPPSPPWVAFPYPILLAHHFDTFSLLSSPLAFCSHVMYIFFLQKLQTLLLSPLSEVSLVGHPDVRQKQLESLLHILHSCGELLHHGWPLILNIIGAINDNHRYVMHK